MHMCLLGLWISSGFWPLGSRGSFQVVVLLGINWYKIMHTLHVRQKFSKKFTQTAHMESSCIHWFLFHVHALLSLKGYPKGTMETIHIYCTLQQLHYSFSKCSFYFTIFVIVLFGTCMCKMTCIDHILLYCIQHICVCIFIFWIATGHSWLLARCAC